MCRSAHRAVYQISLVLFSSLVSFSIGSLCIALVALYHQERAVLIVIACSTILYGFSSFPLTIFLRCTHLQLSFFKILCILFQLVTLGASIEYFNHLIKYTIPSDTHLHKNLLIGLDSLLLCSFLVNGFVLGSTREPICSSQKDNDLESPEPKALMENLQEKIEKYIPVKNSAQTLIPETDTLRNLQRIPPWNVGQDLAAPLTETASLPSVIQHRGEFINLPESTIPDNGNKTSEFPNLKTLMTSPKLKRPFEFKFNSPRAFAKKNRIHLRKRNSTFWRFQNKNRSVSSRHMGRLSTIPDLSRSMLNCSIKSQNLDSDNKFDKSSDSIIDPAHFRSRSRRDSSIPAMELERSAVERINSALLPPCLKVSDSPITYPLSSVLDFGSELLTPVKSDISADNSIERNGLEDIPQVPQLPDETSSNFFTEQQMADIDIPPNVTLENWEKNKETFLKRATSISRLNNSNNNKNSKTSGLLPALQFDNKKRASVPEIPGIPDLQAKHDFCFPVKKPLGPEKNFEDGDYDTISALEQYFRDVNEEQLENINIENGFQHHKESSPSNTQRVSKDLRRNSFRHSPTKSIVSIISGKESLGGLQKSQTMLVNNNNNDGSPTKSSPSRSQRLKRMGKKLSLSNISDTMINMTGNLDSGNEFRSPFKDGRIRGKSVDFSYIYNLQSSHSPTKSTSGLSSNHGSICNNRRHSVATEKSSGKGISNLQLKNGNVNSNANSTANVNFNTHFGTNMNSNADLKLTDAIVECKTPPPNRIPSAESSDVSAVSTTNYPDIVMSEYDRERWNTLLSLQLINSKGQFKTS
ncbi:hypothetical protein ZYGM_001939 [Zygosaccharomyces mellis]|uniref:Uncharacterized protein n=1 Tax=Zygosaccharomyces mellis TaxID=42258 RepID=A0A4C2EHM5_9SACH|nr:hypothetical protein ZYGM_001939 [Zygosaccharomyces mellis]